MDNEISKYSQEPNKLEMEVVARAERGDYEAAHHILCELPILIALRRYESPYISYLADKLTHYEAGVPLERALGIEKDKSTGGAPTRHDVKLAAVDALLRNVANLSKTESIKTIEEKIIDNPEGRDYGSQIRRLRKTFNNIDSLSKTSLLNLSKEYRQKVAEVLPPD